MDCWALPRRPRKGLWEAHRGWALLRPSSQAALSLPHARQSTASPGQQRPHTGSGRQCQAGCQERSLQGEVWWLLEARALLLGGKRGCGGRSHRQGGQGRRLLDKTCSGESDLGSGQ